VTTPGSEPTSRQTIGMAAGLLAGFTMVLGGTVVNVAVPDVMGTYGVGQDTAQFLTTAYVSTMTASQLLAAWFISQFGRRNSFSMIMLLFIAAGILCALSPSMDVLIAGRILQGFCAGIIQPLVMTTIISLYPPEKRGQAIGLYVGVLGLAVGFGPVVGGLTIDALSWRWIFLVSLPFVAVALVVGSFFVPEEPGPRVRQPFDWIGYALLCAALFSLMSAIGNGHREGWTSNLIMTYWVVGGCATLGFILSQHGKESRLLDFSLFLDPRFAAAIALAVVVGVGNFSMAYALPVFGQLVLNLTPTAAGMILLPAGIISSFATIIVGRLLDRVSPLILIFFGISMFVVACTLLSGGDANTPLAVLLGLAVILRLGHSFIGPSTTAVAIRALPASDINKASGTINFFRQMGGAFGINCLVATVEVRRSFHQSALGSTQTDANASTAAFLEAAQGLLSPSGLSEAATHQVALKFLESSVLAQANAFAWRDGFLLLAFVFLFATLPAWLLANLRRRAET
jgi:MFS transporter, DHA2 family, multidrug resistance protein